MYADGLVENNFITMKHLTNKSLLIFSFIVGAFLFAQNAKASPYDSTDISHGVVYDGVTTGRFDVDSIPNSYHITNFIVHAKVDATPACIAETTTHTSGFNMGIAGLLGYGDYMTPADFGVAKDFEVSHGSFTGGGYYIPFDFAGDSYTHYSVGLAYTASVADCHPDTDITLTIYSGTTATSNVSAFTDGNAPYIPSMVFNGTATSSGTSSITFSPNYFTDNLHTPDFSNFWLLINPATTASYDYKILWGTSTPGDIATYDFAPDWGNQTISPSPNGTLHPLVKTASSTPGSYVAQAILYLWNGSSYSSVATSSVFHININGSPPVNTPNPLPGYGITVAANCPKTQFSVFGADFGQGVCTLTRYLFVPDQTALTQFTNLGTQLASTSPISYFYNITNDLTNITVSSSTMTALTLNTGSSTPIHISVDIFSPTTLQKYTSPTALNIIRTLMQAALYLAFISMIILEIRKLFSKPQS
jgi:hypothetical protein